MGRSIPSNANHVMLEWARKQNGFTVEYVEEKEKIPKGRLSEWEANNGTPSYAMLKKLAKRYHYLSQLFYLTEPPEGFTVVRDYRLLPGGADREFSPAMRLAIRRAQERQAWVSEYLEDEESLPASIVGVSKQSDGPLVIAKRMQELFGVSELAQVNCELNSSAYILLRRAAERAGVFVFQASGVAIKEMRGCSLPDKYAPAVLLNAREGYEQKLYTLIHETAHVMLGQTSVSGGGLAEFVARPNVAVEKLCNEVAAEVLVPMHDLVPRVPRDWIHRSDAVLRTLSRRYWVSKTVVVLRLQAAGFVDQQFVDEWFAGLTEKKKKKRDKTPIPYGD